MVGPALLRAGRVANRHPTLTLNLGLRYELPGNNIQSLIDLNESMLQANGNDAVFR